ncbi:2TM domain-containing protein [Seonamhaeicola sp. ML3]|uniref:2TM domain-containing protein n=1 Tax=Seonamhaeicola sp. ML3 TaxID=2937786 RepID=UPI00200E2C6E|nr:2TM domain-containing protein [Seonamhaeicola sp. ML3]
MASKEDINKYSKAKERVKHVKMFYLHLVGYFIVVVLLLYNVYILGENNPYKDFFLWFNSIIIIAWTVFIILHGRWVFKGKTFFSKSWEDKKAREFLEKQKDKDDNTKIWE